MHGMGPYGAITTKTPDVKNFEQFSCDTDFLSINEFTLLVSKRVSRKKKLATTYNISRILN